jgi:hypothetical protein
MSRSLAIASLALGLVIATATASPAQDQALTTTTLTSLTSCPPGQAVEVEVDGAWQRGAITSGPTRAGACVVQLAGEAGLSVEAGQRQVRVFPAHAGVFSHCWPGMRVDVEWNGDWYAASVREVVPMPADGCPITYTGYESSWDESVPTSRIRLASGVAGNREACKAGSAVEVLWNGSWYPATVLRGPDDHSRCFIHYDGYEDSWDEWATPARMRPRR